MTHLPHRERAAELLPAFAAAAVAMLVSGAVPWVSALLVALILGVVVTNTPRVRDDWLARQTDVGRLLLRWGVVLLGLRLPLDAVVGIGVEGIVVVLVTVAATYAGTVALGRRLGLDDGIVTLIATGFSICGAAAIAAVEDAVRTRKGDVGLSVALVTVFGSLMIVLLPAVAHLLGLAPEQAAVWAGASIHEVAQVVAAASIVGPGAVAIATTVKLGRVALLAPVYAWTARREGTTPGHDAPLLPWFVAGFLAAAVVRSSGILPTGLLSVGDTATTVLLAAGMFGLGLGVRVRDLWPVPARVLGLACGSTLIAAGTSLALVVALV